jgi:hypothetical protein
LSSHRKRKRTRCSGSTTGIDRLSALSIFEIVVTSCRSFSAGIVALSASAVVVVATVPWAVAAYCDKIPNVFD